MPTSSAIASCIAAWSPHPESDWPSGLVGGHDPHRVVLRTATVRMAQRLASAGDLVVTRLAHHLDRRLGEPDHARCADGFPQHPPRGRMEGPPPADRGLAGLGELPALTFGREAEVL